MRAPIRRDDVPHVQLLALLLLGSMLLFKLLGFRGLGRGSGFGNFLGVRLRLWIVEERRQETYTVMPVAENEEHRRRAENSSSPRKSTFRVLLRLGSGCDVEELLKGV